MTRYRQPEPPSRLGPPAASGGSCSGSLAVIVIARRRARRRASTSSSTESVAGGQRAHGRREDRAEALDESRCPGSAAIALVIGYDHRAERGRRRAVALGHGDADPRRPADEDDLDALVPARPDRRRPLPGRADLRAARSTRPTPTAARRARSRRCKDLTGLPINYLITVNFRGFKQIVNKLGGVWIDVDRRYFNDNTGSAATTTRTINLQPGYQRLTGGSALDFVRFRHTDSDFYRVARQQLFVKALKQQFAHNFSLVEAARRSSARSTKNVEVGAAAATSSPARRCSATRSSPTTCRRALLPGEDRGVTGYAELTHRRANIAGRGARVREPGRRGADEGDRRRARPEGRRRRRRPPPQTTSRPERERRRRLGRRTPATSSPSAATRSSLPPNGRPANAPTFDYFHTTGLLRPAASAARGGGDARSRTCSAPADVAAAAGRRSRRSQRRDARRRRRPDLPRHDRARAGRRDAEARSRRTSSSNPATSPTARPRRAAGSCAFPLMVPTVLEQLVGARLRRADPRLQDRRATTSAVRLVFRTGGGEYWGIEETDWTTRRSSPTRASATCSTGRAYDLYYSRPAPAHGRPAQDGATLLGRQHAARLALERDDDRDRQGPAAARPRS